MHMIQIKFGYMSFPPKGHMEKKATYMCLGLLHYFFFLHLSRAGLSPQAYVYIQSVIQKLQQNGEMRIIVFKKQ